MPNQPAKRETASMKHANVIAVGLVALGLMLTACASPQEQPEAGVPFSEESAPADAGAEQTIVAPSEPLRVALLPILDSLPYYVAEANGYFEDEGVSVEVVPVASGLERDQLMQSGEIEGMLTELPVVAVFNAAQPSVQVLITARKAYEDAPLFRVLAAPGSGINTPAGLAGVEIGIAENTIIEYVTDRLLQAEGLSDEEIATRSIPAIPERYQLLMEGQIAAANLPDPLAQSAIEQGATNVIDDSAYPEYAVSVLAFSTEAIEQNPDALQAFLRAWDHAAADINSNPEAYRALLLEQVRVPENVQETYQIPPFPRSEVPSPDQWADVNQWLIDKGLLQSELPYEESVSTEFLP